jgi:hypothetical protein
MHSPNSDEQGADTPAPIKPQRLKYGPEPLQFGDLYVPDSPGTNWPKIWQYVATLPGISSTAELVTQAGDGLKHCLM